MPVEFVKSKGQYIFTDREGRRNGFADVAFTDSSPDNIPLTEAVKFASEKGGVLQSAREAAAFRIEANGTDNSNNYQATRTAAVYHTVDGKPFVAFGDSPEVVENPILARANEGYNQNTRGTWFLPKSDRQISAVLERAKIDDRIVELSKNIVKLSTRGIPSKFGDSKIGRAVLGDTAQPYAEFLNRTRYGEDYGYRKAYAHMLTGDSLKKLGVTDKNVEVRTVRLGVGPHLSITGSFDNRFGYDGVGFARGVKPAYVKLAVAPKAA